MSLSPYDVVIRGGTVATAADVFEADIGITGETIAAIGRNLPAGAREMDATGKLVLPGRRRHALPHRAAVRRRNYERRHL